jgi:hypothetical protein
LVAVKVEVTVVPEPACRFSVGLAPLWNAVQVEAPAWVDRPERRTGVRTAGRGRAHLAPPSSAEPIEQ